MLEVMIFLFLGVLAGAAMGLVPGIHPNMIILAMPFLLQMNVGVLPFLAFIVSMGVVNCIIDFIPSVVLGAPESGNELSVLPGHRMLLDGNGYGAIRLAVIGSVGSIIVLMLLLPVIVLAVPVLYNSISGFVYILLIGIVVSMFVSEKKSKMLSAVLVFSLAGLVGVFMGRLPVSGFFLLFPVFSGFFGVSMLVVQIRQKTKMPAQTEKEIVISKKTVNRSVFLGTLAGIAAGFLPGVGSSEIASVVSSDKNGESFLIKMGALTTANTILAVMSLWLIAKSRSGLAAAISQVTEVSTQEIVFIIAVAVFSVGIACLLTLSLARKFLKIIARMDYVLVSKTVIAFLAAATFMFTGATGLVLLCACTALGVYANLSGIKRSSMMGVLLVPTILFYVSAA